jgi:hypothetical protein
MTRGVQTVLLALCLLAFLCLAATESRRNDLGATASMDGLCHSAQVDRTPSAKYKYTAPWGPPAYTHCSRTPPS